jgi:hypothetical protein
MKISNFQMRSFAALDLISKMMVCPDRQCQFPLFGPRSVPVRLIALASLPAQLMECIFLNALAVDVSKGFSKKILETNFKIFTKSKMYMTRNRRKGVLLLAPGGT